jgi:hypothetical protein
MMSDLEDVLLPTIPKDSSNDRFKPFVQGYHDLRYCSSFRIEVDILIVFPL